MRLFNLTHVLIFLLSFPYIALTLPAHYSLSNASVPPKRPSLDSVATALENRRESFRFRTGDIILGFFEGSENPMLVLRATKRWLWVVPFGKFKAETERLISVVTLNSFYTFQGSREGYNQYHAWSQLQYFSAIEQYEKIARATDKKKVHDLIAMVGSLPEGRGSVRFLKERHISREIPLDLMANIDRGVFFGPRGQRDGGSRQVLDDSSGSGSQILDGTQIDGPWGGRTVERSPSPKILALEYFLHPEAYYK